MPAVLSFHFTWPSVMEGTVKNTWAGIPPDLTIQGPKVAAHATKSGSTIIRIRAMVK